MNKTSKLILTGVFLSMMAVLFFVAVAPSKVEATNYPSCTSHASKKCANGNLYWFDSCGKQQELAQDCGTTGFTNVVRCDPAQATRDTIVKEKVEKGCSNNACFANSSWVSTETNCLTQGKVCRLGQCVNIACRSNADCGVSNPTGSPSCQGENMYQNYTTYTCVNPGAVNSSCTSGTTSQPITVFSGQAYQNIPTPGIQHTSFGIRTTTPTVTTTQSGVNNATMKLENLTSETKVINYRTWSCRCKEKFGNDAGACTKFWDGQTSESAYQATSCQAEEKTLTLAGNETKNISLSTTQYNNNVCGSIQDDLFFLSVNGAPAGGTFDGGALFMGGALSYFCNDCQVTPPPPPPPPPPPTQTCGDTGLSKTLTIKGIQFTPISQSVDGNSTNTSLVSVKNLDSSVKTLIYNEEDCRCQNHLGNNSTSECYGFWPTSDSCVSTQKTILLSANETKTVSMSVTQHQNQMCGSFQNDLTIVSVNGIPENNLAAWSFADLCTDCSGTQQATCNWQGHCEGASCTTFDDCDGNLVCNSGKCSTAGQTQPLPPPPPPPPPPNNPPANDCIWLGHCEGDPCQTFNDCTGNLVCNSGKCGPIENGSTTTTPPPPPPTTGSGTGMISFTFDDGWQSSFQNGIPLLDKYGLKSTNYIISGEVGDTANGYMDLAQISDLQNRGHEIEAHTKTHPDLTLIDSTQMSDEILGSKQALEAMGISPITSFDYPFGTYNSAVEQVVRSAGYLGARTADNGDNKKGDNPYLLKVMSVELNTPIADVEQRISSAMANNTWLILLLHQVDNNGGQYSVTPDKLSQIVDYVHQNNVKTVKVSEGISEITN